MIFCSHNEAGRLKADWIKSLPIGAYFVTRRLEPVKVGSIRAIQPGRGKKAVAWAKVLWCKKHVAIHSSVLQQHEADREGFMDYDGLLWYFEKRNINIADTYRISMQKVRNHDPT